MLKYAFGILTLILLAGILFFAIVPDPGSIIPVRGVDDKLLHFAEFTAFTFVFALTLMHFKVQSHFTWAIVAAALVGTITELAQILSPPRSPSVLDFFANMAGACVAVGILFAFERLVWKRSRQSS